MSFVITAIVASTALSVYGQQSAAKSEQESMNRRAEEEKMAAQGRALERQQELGKVLARNNMQLAQDGSSGEGTPASIALQSSKNIGSSEQTFNLTSRLRQAQFRREGKLARSGANINSLGSIFKAGGAIAGNIEETKRAKLAADKTSG